MKLTDVSILIVITLAMIILICGIMSTPLIQITNTNTNETQQQQAPQSIPSIIEVVVTATPTKLQNISLNEQPGDPYPVHLPIIEKK